MGTEKKDIEENTLSGDIKAEKSLKKKQGVPSSKSKLKDTPAKTKKPEKSQNDSLTRKMMPSKPTPTVSQSKMKKDESNKKVMETRKAAVLAKSKRKPEEDDKTKAKKITPKSKGVKQTKKEKDSEEGIKVNEKNVAEKVTEAIASGQIDDSRLIKDEDEDKESVVEKDQIEDMETSAIREKPLEQDYDKDVDEDEEEIELQRIKDDDEDDNQQPVPDIGGKITDEFKDGNQEEKKLPLDKNTVKIPYTHVKTPDEVDDLPEHEAVIPDDNIMKEIQSDESEEKILQDEKEKEDHEKLRDELDKSEESIEALRSNEIVEVAVEQKKLPTPDVEIKRLREIIEPSENEKLVTTDLKEKVVTDEEKNRNKILASDIEKEAKKNNESGLIPAVESKEIDKQGIKNEKVEASSDEDKRMEKLPSVETEDLESKHTVSISIDDDIESSKAERKDKTVEKEPNLMKEKKKESKGDKDSDEIDDSSQKNQNSENKQNDDYAQSMSSSVLEDGIIQDGVLKIIIHKAQCMENMDIVGKSDPFVEINFKDKKVKSETVKNTQFPEWNFSTQFDILKSDTDNILVSIFDDDFGKTDFQGYITLSLHEAIRKAGKPAMWHDLIKNTWKGRVSISTEFFCSSHESTNLTGLDIESNKEGHVPIQKEKEKPEDDHKKDSMEKKSEGTLNDQEQQEKKRDM